MPKEVAYSTVNSQGNLYVKYTDGGYRYNNAPTKGQPAGSTFYSPLAKTAAVGAGFYNERGGAAAGAAHFYKNMAGERSSK